MADPQILNQPKESSPDGQMMMYILSGVLNQMGLGMPMSRSAVGFMEGQRQMQHQMALSNQATSFDQQYQYNIYKKYLQSQYGDNLSNEQQKFAWERAGIMSSFGQVASHMLPRDIAYGVAPAQMLTQDMRTMMASATLTTGGRGMSNDMQKIMAHAMLQTAMPDGKIDDRLFAGAAPGMAMGVAQGMMNMGMGPKLSNDPNDVDANLPQMKQFIAKSAQFAKVLQNVFDSDDADKLMKSLRDVMGTSLYRMSQGDIETVLTGTKEMAKQAGISIEMMTSIQGMVAEHLGQVGASQMAGAVTSIGMQAMISGAGGPKNAWSISPEQQMQQRMAQAEGFVTSDMGRRLGMLRGIKDSGDTEMSAIEKQILEDMDSGDATRMQRASDLLRSENWNEQVQTKINERYTVSQIGSMLEDAPRHLDPVKDKLSTEFIQGYETSRDLLLNNTGLTEEQLVNGFGSMGQAGKQLFTTVQEKGGLVKTQRLLETTLGLTPEEAALKAKEIQRVQQSKEYQAAIETVKTSPESLAALQANAAKTKVITGLYQNLQENSLGRTIMTLAATASGDDKFSMDVNGLRKIYNFQDEKIYDAYGGLQKTLESMRGLSSADPEYAKKFSELQKKADQQGADLTTLVGAAEKLQPEDPKLNQQFEDNAKAAIGGQDIAKSIRDNDPNAGRKAGEWATQVAGQMSQRGRLVSGSEMDKSIRMIQNLSKKGKLTDEDREDLISNMEFLGQRMWAGEDGAAAMDMGKKENDAKVTKERSGATAAETGKDDKKAAAGQMIDNKKLATEIADALVARSLKVNMDPGKAIVVKLDPDTQQALVTAAVAAGQGGN